MYPKKVANDTAKVLQSYLTYQAVRTIIDQLTETNPSQAIWLRQQSAENRIQDGEAFLQSLMQDNKELVLRILTVREHLAEAVLDFLPEMVRSNIGKSNTDCRRQILERLTQTPALKETSPGVAPTSSTETHPEIDLTETHPEIDSTDESQE
ncbi:MAG: chaperonin family protein RbcX [Cyanobacteria bacterium SID2]|nr:chaperonin family protein RbcX [Cyanobacteria bacterium SID2]MBP0003003.1 chaperonin family protein RbcX [Cyanobacteria bacterium SBC]